MHWILRSIPVGWTRVRQKTHRAQKKPPADPPARRSPVRVGQGVFAVRPVPRECAQGPDRLAVSSRIGRIQQSKYLSSTRDTNRFFFLLHRHDRSSAHSALAPLSEVIGHPFGPTGILGSGVSFPHPAPCSLHLCTLTPCPAPCFLHFCGLPRAPHPVSCLLHLCRRIPHPVSCTVMGCKYCPE